MAARKTATKPSKASAVTAPETTVSAGNGHKSALDSLKELSVEEIQKHLQSRIGKSTARENQTGVFSVEETLRGKSIFMIGGTGFLGRIMLYHLLRFVPDLKHIYLLIRPTHGQTGNDRLRREILGSPVLTTNPGDAEFFADVVSRKLTVVEGDASRLLATMDPKIVQEIQENCAAVLNTAGNVEFNPPLDLSLSANTLATREVLDFVRKMKSRKYLHISTCYVADRALYPDRAPEIPVAFNVRTPDGEFRIDADREIDECMAEIDRLRRANETPERIHESIIKTRDEIEKSGHHATPALVERMAKNRRTFELREELTKAGKRRAERIGRPNVYTYTKTLAELLLQQAADEIEYTIVRPSIVETSTHHPFPGWNEGIQGSAPLMYMIHRGHRFLPSLSKDPSRRPDSNLDVIPVDHVAGGTVLALAALIRGEQAQVYQLAAGQIEPLLSATRFLNLVQLAGRTHVREEGGISAWLRLNIPAVNVSVETFERFSSPASLRILTKAKERLHRFKERRYPKRRHEEEGPAALGPHLLDLVTTGVDRFYNISMLKNRILSEFMPFMNHGYPVFENGNTRALFRRLPPAEQEHFIFAPDRMDYAHYIGRTHLEAVRRWIFPVLEKRFAAVAKAGTTGKGADWTQLWKDFKGILTPGQSLGERISQLREIAGRSAPAAERGESPAGFAPKDVRAVLHSLPAVPETVLASDFSGLSPEAQEALAVHASLISGKKITRSELGRIRSREKLERLIEQEVNEEDGSSFLPRDGVNFPEWAASPVKDFCYNLQMWFYRSALDVRIRGKENIPLRNRNVIIVANHCSHLDYGLVWYALGDYARDMGILAARDYFFSNFWNSTFFQNFHNLVPIERGEAVRTHADALGPAFAFMKAGGPLLIFPEGTRSPDGQLQPFKHGLGFLVMKTGADVLPMRLFGTDEALPKGSRVLKNRKVSVVIGKVVTNETLTREVENFSPTRSYHHVTGRIEQEVHGLGL